MNAGQDMKAETVEAPMRGATVTRQRRARLLILGAFVSLFALSASYHSFIYTPQPDQPHRLTLLDDLFCLQLASLIALVGLSLGWRLLRRFPLPALSRLERGTLALGLGWGMLSLAVLALGLAHLLYSWLLIALFGASLLLCWRDLWRLTDLLAPSTLLRSLIRLLPASLFGRGLALLVLLDLPLLLLQTFTLPYLPRGYDLYQYHWAVPKLYLFHHAIYAIPGWAHANFPFQTEMLNLLAFAFSAPVTALMLQALYGLLAVLLLAGVLFRHAGSLAAWLGAALCLSSPLFRDLLPTGYAEMAVTYYGVAAVVVVLAWVKQAQPTRGPGFWLLFLAGLFVGFGLGAKYWEVQIAAGIMLLLAVTALVEIVRAQKHGASPLQVIRYHLLGALAFGTAILLPLLPWLGKDWLLLGNPIYPFLWGGAGWDQARTQVGLVTLAHFGPQGPLWQRLGGAFFGLFFDAAHAGELPLIPPNYLLLAALLPGVLFLLWCVLRWRKHAPTRLWQWAGSEELRWLVIIAGAYLAWVLSHASVDRYALPWIVLLCVPAALTLQRLCQVVWQRPLLRSEALLLRTALPGFILLAVIVLGPLLSLQIWSFPDPLSLLTGKVSLQRWQALHIMDPSYWATIDYVNTHLPHTGKLLLLGRGTGYFITEQDYVADSDEDWIPYLESEGKTPGGILALLRQEGFTYVVYEENTLRFVVTNYENPYLGSFLPAFSQFLSSSLIELQTFANFHIYAIPPP